MDVVFQYSLIELESLWLFHIHLFFTNFQWKIVLQTRYAQQEKCLLATYLTTYLMPATHLATSGGRSLYTSRKILRLSLPRR